MKLISIIVSILIGSAFAMEQKDSDLKGMLFQAPSLKFLAAWQAVKQPIDPAKVPEEVLEFVNKIKTIQACTECNEDEKKLFINILNNPEIDIEKAFPNLIKKYLGKEKFTNLKQFFNKVLLHTAKENKIEVANLALEFGADVDVKDDEGDTALIWAIRKYNTKMVQLLLAKGADANIKNKEGNTALILATGADNKEIIKMLLDKGADVNVKNNNGYTALIWAAFLNNKDIAQMLLDKGTDVNVKDNNNGYTALIWAAKNNNTEIVGMLLTKGADINITNNSGETALALAQRHRNTEIVKLLKAQTKAKN